MPGSSKRVKHLDAILILRIPEAEREQIARLAYTRGMTLSDAAREALAAWLVARVGVEAGVEAGAAAAAAVQETAL